MTTQSDGPGYVAQLRKGATSLTEAWDGTHSNNHLMLGHIETWFFEGLGGIQPDPVHPGFSHFFLRPQFPTDLASSNVTHNSPHGQIVSNWKRDNQKISCTFIIPENTTATLTLNDKTEDLSPGTYTRELEAPKN